MDNASSLDKSIVEEIKKRNKNSFVKELNSLCIKYGFEINVDNCGDIYLSDGCYSVTVLNGDDSLSKQRI